jgi:hypothetical protein
MTDDRMHLTYVDVYNDLLAAASSLEFLKRNGSEGSGVEPRAGAAMHAVRFALALLHPAASCQPLPPVPDDPQQLLDLAAHWRDAALGLGEFAPEPDLRLITREKGSESTPRR